MNLTISSLGFGSMPLPEALSALQATSISGIELAPSQVWPQPLHSTPTERLRLRGSVENAGFRIVALQALYYGADHLRMFAGPKLLEASLEHLHGMARLSADLGSTLLSFGSLHVRKRGALPLTVANSIAEDFFSRAADLVATCGQTIALEPIHSSFGCDFINTCAEAAQLIRRVNHPNLKLLVDVSAMRLAGEDPEDVWSACHDIIRHVHLNDPGLLPPAESEFHRRCKTSMQRGHYAGHCSFEFIGKHQSAPSLLAALGTGIPLYGA